MILFGAMGKGGSRYTFEPVTAERWSDIVELFGDRGACGGCWCMFWRKTRAEFERDKGSKNRAGLRALVKKSPPPGILTYHEGKAVGWCAVAPRQNYIGLANSRVLRPVDDACGLRAGRSCGL